MAAAMMPKIPKIHGRRPADCVAGFDCAGLLVGCPVPVVVLPDPGLYPLPGLEFGPELELGPESDPDPERALRVAVVTSRSVTAQPRVPLRLRLGWIIAIIGQTMPTLRAEPITGPQDWRNEIETDRL